MAEWVHVVLIPYKFFSYNRSFGFSSFYIKVENSEYYQALNIWFCWKIYSTLDFGQIESNSDPYLIMTRAFCFRISLSYFSEFLHIFSGLKVMVTCLRARFFQFISQNLFIKYIWFFSRRQGTINSCRR